MRNFITILMISQGTPMFFSGDEVQSTKNGNNNTYCHDNELNWFNWKLIDKNRDFFSFCQALIAFRKAHPALRREDFFNGSDTTLNEHTDIIWHGVKLNSPDWGSESHTLAFKISGCRTETGADRDDNDIYAAFNSYWENLEFELPRAGKGLSWYMAVNTNETPGFYTEGSEIKISSKKIEVAKRSCIVLISKRN
jgi:isoamylase